MRTIYLVLIFIVASCKTVNKESEIKSHADGIQVSETKGRHFKETATELIGVTEDLNDKIDNLSLIRNNPEGENSETRGYMARARLNGEIIRDIYEMLGRTKTLLHTFQKNLEDPELEAGDKYANFDRQKYVELLDELKRIIAEKRFGASEDGVLIKTIELVAQFGIIVEKYRSTSFASGEEEARVSRQMQDNFRTIESYLRRNIIRFLRRFVSEFEYIHYNQTYAGGGTGGGGGAGELEDKPADFERVPPPAADEFAFVGPGYTNQAKAIERCEKMIAFLKESTLGEVSGVNCANLERYYDNRWLVRSKMTLKIQYGLAYANIRIGEPLKVSGYGIGNLGDCENHLKEFLSLMQDAVVLHASCHGGPYIKYGVPTRFGEVRTYSSKTFEHSDLQAAIGQCKAHLKTLAGGTSDAIIESYCTNEQVYNNRWVYRNVSFFKTAKRYIVEIVPERDIYEIAGIGKWLKVATYIQTGQKSAGEICQKEGYRLPSKTDLETAFQFDDYRIGDARKNRVYAKKLRGRKFWTTSSNGNKGVAIKFIDGTNIEVLSDEDPLAQHNILCFGP
jgi:hypothetical protein